MPSTLIRDQEEVLSPSPRLGGLPLRWLAGVLATIRANVIAACPQPHPRCRQWASTCHRQPLLCLDSLAQHKPFLYTMIPGY
ncbi:hypothetical protein NKDENANG_03021 [Candidatus Entotheonellaceae bacterium PAL068K]